MNAVRMRSMIGNLTGTARKVFEVVPIAEAWTPQQIVGELRRSRVSFDFSCVAGCLRTLESQGLIRREPGERYTREPMIDPAPSKKDEPMTTEAPPPAPAALPIAPADPGKKPKPTPSERIAYFASKLRSEAGELRARAKDLRSEAEALEARAQSFGHIAGDIEDAALDWQAEEEASSAEYGKLKQLAGLLRSLS
jgi:hypothetical protein